MSKFQITLSVLIAVSAIATGQNQAEESLKWKTLIKDNYEIKYPSDWEVDQSGQMGTSFILFSPQSGPTDNFKENINLIVQDLGENKLSLDQYVELSEVQIKTLISDSKIIYNERLRQDDVAYQKVIYSGKQGIYDLTFEQYYRMVDVKAYVLTFTCARDQFENFKTLGEEVLDSFMLK